MDKRRVCVAVDASNTSKSALEWVGRSQLAQKMDEASPGLRAKAAAAKSPCRPPQLLPPPPLRRRL